LSQLPFEWVAGNTKARGSIGETFLIVENVSFRCKLLSNVMQWVLWIKRVNNF